MNKIFKWFTQDGAQAKIEWFVDSFDVMDFQGVDRMLAAFLEFCAFLNIPAQRKYLESFLKTDGKQAMRIHDVRIDIVGNYNMEDPGVVEEASRILKALTLDTYDSYCSENVEGHTFKVDMYDFMQRHMREGLESLMTEAYPKISMGEDLQMMTEDLTYQIQRLRSNYSKDKLNKLDFMEGRTAATGTVSEREVLRHLFTTGLPCVDGDIGGMYSKQLWALGGSPGTGKTRMASVQFAYRAMVTAKIDVLFDELELSALEVKNIMVAHHIVNLYMGRVKIPDSLINKNKLTSEQRGYVEAARIDLFESGKYGKLIVRDDSMYVEHIEDEMYAFLRRNRNVQLWIIDYAGHVGSKPVDRYSKKLDTSDIIYKLYKTVKQIVKTADIGALILNQFNKEGVDAAKMGKKIVAGHVQGGMIVEQESDYDLAMTATEEQEQAGMFMLSTAKKRSAAGFDNVPFESDKSVSIFRQLNKSAVN